MINREMERPLAEVDPEIAQAITEQKALDEGLESQLGDAINEFKNSTGFVETNAPVQAAG